MDKKGIQHVPNGLFDNVQCTNSHNTWLVKCLNNTAAFTSTTCELIPLSLALIIEELVANRIRSVMTCAYHSPLNHQIFPS